METLRAAIIGSFIGDSFNLAPHWNYNVTKLERLYGRLTDIVDLPEDTYHTTRQAGEFTHYGDQAMWLLEYVSRNRSFDFERFALTWQENMLDFDGYRDGASKDTLDHFRSGRRQPSTSNDLAGISRMAGLLLGHNLKDEQALVDAARELTAMTHGDPQVIDAAEFFMRLLFRVQAGESISKAIKALSYRHFEALPAGEWIQKVRDLPEMTTPQAIVKLGQTCHVDHAFQSTIYVLLKHGHSFEEAMIENTMGGGDNAARGMIIGLILGAVHGEDAIPLRWRQGTKALPHMEELIEAALPVSRFGSEKFDF